MKFEFVEFYPFTNDQKVKYKKNSLGTLHIYAIDCELDIRGIHVTRNGDKMYFHMPHFYGLDAKTGQQVKYPILKWTNERVHKEMMEFLHNQVKTAINKNLSNNC